MSSDLKVTIGGDSTGLQGALKGAESHVSAFGARLAGALSLAAIGSAINRMIDLGAETVRTAQRVNLSTDAVQAFADTAQMAGIEADLMFNAVQRIQTAQIDALADAGSKAATSFAKLGIDVRGLDTEQIVVAFAVALSQAGDNADALSAAIDIVGQRNARLLGTFRDIGKEGPDAVRKIADAMRLELVDPASLAKLNEAKRVIEDAKDKLLSFGQKATAWAIESPAASFSLPAVLMGMLAKRGRDLTGEAEARRQAGAAAATSGVMPAPAESYDSTEAIRAAREEYEAGKARDAGMLDLGRRIASARLRASGRGWEADAQEFLDALSEKGAAMQPGDSDKIRAAFQQLEALKSGPNKTLMENAFTAEPAADRLARIGALSGRVGQQDLVARSLSVQQEQLAELRKLNGKDGAVTLA